MTANVHEETPASAVAEAELPTHGVQITEVAAGKVRSLLEQEGRTDLRLRVAVQPGGCSGLIYQLYFDERVLDGDAVRDFDGVEVVEEGERNRQLDAEVFETAPRPRARQDCNLLRQKHAYTSAETRP